MVVVNGPSRSPPRVSREGVAVILKFLSQFPVRSLTTICAFRLDIRQNQSEIQYTTSSVVYQARASRPIEVPLLYQPVCADLRILLAEYLVWEPEIHKASPEQLIGRVGVFAMEQCNICMRPDNPEDLDAPTERAVLASLAEFREFQTLILISHRISSLAWMDRFVLLDQRR
jgi:hypothetical protein